MDVHYIEIELPAGKENYKKEVLDCPVPVIVDFHAEWCGPCKLLTPKLREQLKNSKSFKLVKINVDEHEEIAEEFGISGIPAVYLIKNGKVVMNFSGNNVEELEKMVAETKK
jgi:thioredoxin 1